MSHWYNASHWANDPGSLFIIGRTQTGKTTTAREIAAESSRITIWVNRRGTERVRKVPGNRYQSLEGIEAGFRRDETTFNLLSADPAADVAALQSWLWDIAERADRKLPLTLVVDEIHSVAPQSQKDELAGRDAVRRIAKEGQKRNIKLVGVTQDVVSMDKQALRQREYLLVYSLTAEQARYMSDYGVDTSVVNAQPTHAGILYHASGDVVSTGVKARSKYA
jgi:DNA helicase HerA-like ATPase